MVSVFVLQYTFICICRVRRGGGGSEVKLPAGMGRGDLDTLAGEATNPSSVVVNLVAANLRAI